MLLDGTLEPVDYKTIKNRYESSINDLENRLRNISHDSSDLDNLIRYGRLFFTHMDEFYTEGTLSVKQQLIGSMFPEKLVFENKTYRTIKKNPLIPLTCRPSKDSRRLKNKKTGNFAGLSNKAPPAGDIKMLKTNSLNLLCKFQRKRTNWQIFDRITRSFYNYHGKAPVI